MSQQDPSKSGPARRELTEVERRNRRLGLICAGAFFAMVGAAFASVPIYRAFCEFTGFDGATRRAKEAASHVSDKTLSVRFDVNTRGGLPWTFTAEQTRQDAKLGETKLALFRVTNNSDKPVTGRALFNVVPSQAGPYFQKLECFCFSDQTLQPGQTVDMPVLYFVDPKYGEDFETRGKQEVTLSYTFFPSADAPAPAIEHSRVEGGVPRG